MLQNAVAMTSTTTGFGAYDTLPLTGDVAPLFSTFVEGFGNGAIVPYRAEMAPDWEEGYGTVTAGSPDTLTRTVTRSSNGDAAVNWPAGTKLIVQHFPADPLRFGAIGSVPTATGTGNAPGIAHVPPLMAIRPGMRGSFYAAAANTGNVTLEIDGISAQPLRRTDGEELDAGALRVGALVKWYAHSATELRIDADQTGPLGWEQIGAPTVATSAIVVEFTLPAEFSAFRLEGQQISASSDAQVMMQISLDGINYEDGVSDYTYSLHFGYGSTSGADEQTGLSIDLTRDIDASDPRNKFTATIDPGSASRKMSVVYQSGTINTVPKWQSMTGHGGYIAVGRAMKVALFLTGAGPTISGRFTLFGLR